jgi:hypothetical protein
MALQTAQSELPISFPVQSPEVAAYFAEMARPGDIASVSPAQLFLLSQDTVGQKMVAFRSLSEAQQQLDTLTGPVDMVMYNPEHWEYTPEEEQQDLATTVQQFADLIHSQGMQFMFAPDRRYAEEYLKQVAPYIDSVLLQGQQLQHDPQTFATWVLGMADVGHSANPELQVFVQVGATRGTASEMYAAIQTVAGGIDGIAVWSLPRTLDVLQEFVTLVREGPAPAEATPTSPVTQSTEAVLSATPEAAPPAESATAALPSTTPAALPTASPSSVAAATTVTAPPAPAATVPPQPQTTPGAYEGLVTDVLLFIGGIGIGVAVGFFVGWRLRQ